MPVPGYGGWTPNTPNQADELRRQQSQLSPLAKAISAMRNRENLTGDKNLMESKLRDQVAEARKIRTAVDAEDFKRKLAEAVEGGAAP